MRIIAKHKIKHTPVFIEIPSLNKTHPIIANTVIPTTKPKILLSYMDPPKAVIKFCTLFMKAQLIGRPKNIRSTPYFCVHPHLMPACNWINDKTCPMIPYKTP